MGRKKTQMKMSQGNGARQVAPPFRRPGLFKMASEVTTLCALETTLVIFSPAGKAFSFAHPGVGSFGHPVVELVITNLARTGNSGSGSCQRTLADQEATLQALEKEYHDLLEQLEAEKKRGEILQKRKMMNQKSYCRQLWETPVEELNLEELLTLKAIIEDVEVKLQKHMAERLAQTYAPTEGSSVDLNGHEKGPGN